MRTHKVILESKLISYVYPSFWSGKSHIDDVCIASPSPYGKHRWIRQPETLSEAGRIDPSIVENDSGFQRHSLIGAIMEQPIRVTDKTQHMTAQAVFNV